MPTSYETINMNGHSIDNVEDLEVNDIADYDQGEIFITDNIEVDGDEVPAMYADADNLNLYGGDDPVVIGIDGWNGTPDDLVVEGDFLVDGSKDCVVRAKDGHSYSFSVIESPEVWFEEKLSGELKNGICEIILDDRFLASTVIDENHPLHTIATPTSEGSLWTEKFYDKIIIHGTCSTFDVTISAKRLNYEDIRFDEWIRDEDLKTLYKKSKEDLFLSKKPLKLQVRQIKDTFKQEVEQVKNKKIDKKMIKSEIKNLRKDRKKEVKNLAKRLNLINENYKKNLHK